MSGAGRVVATYFRILLEHAGLSGSADRMAVEIGEEFHAAGRHVDSLEKRIEIGRAQGEELERRIAAVERRATLCGRCGTLVAAPGQAGVHTVCPDPGIPPDVEAVADAYAGQVSTTTRMHGDIVVGGVVYETVTAAVRAAFLAGVRATAPAGFVFHTAAEPPGYDITGQVRDRLAAAALEREIDVDAIADELTAGLFRNSFGVAERLVLMTADGRDLGGWTLGPVREAIARDLRRVAASPTPAVLEALGDDTIDRIVLAVRALGRSFEWDEAPALDLLASTFADYLEDPKAARRAIRDADGRNRRSRRIR